MFRPFIGSLVVIAGCAEISGLGTLEVCDGACVDDASVQDSSSQDQATQDSAGDAQPETASDATTVDAPILTDGMIDAPPPPGCVKPSDCSQNDLCCGTISTQGNSPPCQITNVTTKCQATCTTNISQKCGTDTVRLCATNQDCTEFAYNRCCKFPYGNNSYVEVCSNLATADAGGATCL